MAKKKTKRTKKALTEFEEKVQKEALKLHGIVGVERAISTNQHTLKKAREDETDQVVFLEAVDVELKAIRDKENK